MEECDQYGKDFSRSQRGYERKLAPVVLSTTRAVVSSANMLFSPDSDIPSEKIENVRDFFNQILIKKIDHIDNKINDIVTLSSNNYSVMKQVNKNISDNIESKIKEIKQANGVHGFDLQQLSKFVTSTVDAKLNELNQLNIQNRKLTKVISGQNKEITQMAIENKNLVQTLEDVKHSLASKQAINTPVAQNHEGVVAEIHKLTEELSLKISSSETAVIQEIRDTVEKLQEGNDTSSEFQVDNILGILEKVEKMDKEFKCQMKAMESNMSTRFVKMDICILGQMRSLEELIKNQVFTEAPEPTPTDQNHYGKGAQGWDSPKSGNPPANSMRMKNGAPPPFPPEVDNTNTTPKDSAPRDSGKPEVLRIKDWPKFNGEGEYDHLEFSRTIELMKEDFELSDPAIAGRLSSLFKGTASRWFNDIRTENGRQP
jgi:hypothetical protein